MAIEGATIDDISRTIANTTFELARRGYDTAAVDAFLDELEEGVRELEEALRAERLHNAELRRTLALRAAASDDVEAAYLAAAEKRDTMLAEAQAEATRIVAEARQRAEELVRASTEETDRARRDAEGILLEARARLDDAEVEAERILAAARARHDELEEAIAASRSRAEQEAERMLTEARETAHHALAEARREAEEVLAGAREEYDLLVGRILALKEAVAGMLAHGLATSEPLRLVAGDEAG